MITAEVHSDDRTYHVDFDAESWFDDASDQEIIDLAECGWGGDYPADTVALALEDTNSNIEQLMDYCRRTQGRRGSVGFECHVDSHQAEEWLKQNRSWILLQIDAPS